MAAAPARASFVYTLQEQGNDVVLSGSGTLKLEALTRGGDANLTNTVWAKFGIVMRGGAAATYTGFTGPTSFGTGGNFGTTTATGDLVAICCFAPTRFLGLAGDYVSGDPLAASATFANTTLAAMGVTPGSYVWNWGQGETADSLTLRIVAPVPEPATAALLSTGLLGAGLLGRTRARRRRAAAAA